MPSDKAAMLPSNAVRRLRVMRASSWSRSEVAGIERHLDRALIIGDGSRLRSKIVGNYEQLHVRRRPPVADGLVGGEHERAVDVAARREPLVEERNLDDGVRYRPPSRVAHGAAELVL